MAVRQGTGTCSGSGRNLYTCGAAGEYASQRWHIDADDCRTQSVMVSLRGEEGGRSSERGRSVPAAAAAAAASV